MVLDRPGPTSRPSIAGLLHDVVEDTDLTLEDRSGGFRRPGGRIVADCSEVKLDEGARNAPGRSQARHIAAISGAPDASKAVTLADKYHNLAEHPPRPGGGMAGLGRLSMPTVTRYECEEALLGALADYLPFAKTLELQLPFWMFAALVGCEGARICLNRSWGDLSEHPIDRNAVWLPETKIDAFDIDPVKHLCQCSTCCGTLPGWSGRSITTSRVIANRGGSAEGGVVR